MARLSVKLREKKRRETVLKFKAKRLALLETLQNPKTSDEDRDAARAKLQKLPRDASPSRLRNRCALTGRPRGVYRKFGLGRIKLRELAMRGEVPGVVLDCRSLHAECAHPPQSFEHRRASQASAAERAQRRDRLEVPGPVQLVDRDPGKHRDLPVWCNDHDLVLGTARGLFEHL